MVLVGDGARTVRSREARFQPASLGSSPVVRFSAVYLLARVIGSARDSAHSAHSAHSIGQLTITCHCPQAQPCTRARTLSHPDSQMHLQLYACNAPHRSSSPTEWQQPFHTVWY